MSPDPANSNHPRPYLLVVDDDAAVRDSVQVLFTSIGYEVAVASNGAEALDHMAQRSADVVLTDIYMEGCDGFELIAALRKKHRQTLVAAMSGGHLGYDTLSFANRLGADAVIDKPFRDLQLVETLDRLVRNYHRLPE